jgi:hypothetical protein
MSAEQLIINYIKRNRKLKRRGFKDYGDFIQSEMWFDIKELAYLRLRKRECFFCHEDFSDLHHVKYTKITNRTLRWLVPVCRKCHENIHKNKKDSIYRATRKYGESMGKEKGFLRKRELSKLWIV